MEKEENVFVDEYLTSRNVNLLRRSKRVVGKRNIAGLHGTRTEKY